MNRLNTVTRCQIIGALVEGNSIRATVPMTGAAKNTIQKLLLEVGAKAIDYHDRAMHNLPCKRIQVDECWAFCYAKAKNVTPEIRERNPFAGDVWTWAAIDADTKLIPSWTIGPRDGVTARIFVNDLASRLADRVQLTSDGLAVYLQAVERAFHGHIDYAMLQKIYNSSAEGEKRYSPAECIGCERKIIDGNPDPAHKIENHTAAVALHLLHYNFVRIHQTLRTTPAMAAGVTDRLWEIRDIVALLDGLDSN